MKRVSFDSIHSSQDKIAELFDMPQTGNESLTQYRQRLLSMADHFKTNSPKKQPQQQMRVVTAPVKEDLDKIKYCVVGYDENLIKMRKQKSQRVRIVEAGKELSASELFRLASEFVKNALPQKYIDEYGNVWQKMKV